MKTTLFWLVPVLIIAALSAWLANTWRLEGTEYETKKSELGSIEKERLLSQGLRGAETVKATWIRRGEEAASRLLEEAKRKGNLILSESEKQKSGSTTIRATTIAEFIIRPLQIAEVESERFRIEAIDARSEQERRTKSRISELLLNAHNAIMNDHELLITRAARGLSGCLDSGFRR